LLCFFFIFLFCVCLLFFSFFICFILCFLFVCFSLLYYSINRSRFNSPCMKVVGYYISNNNYLTKRIVIYL
jgi:hypothetical protein